jgi:hypothetical protein
LFHSDLINFVAELVVEILDAKAYLRGQHQLAAIADLPAQHLRLVAHSLLSTRFEDRPPAKLADLLGETRRMDVAG